jgi:ribonuclease Z
VLLGTGGFLNYEREQTCLALPLAGAETLLIDTTSGPVVLRQLQRAGIPLESVRHVLVTHQHPDHAGGLPYLLVARKVWAGEPPMTVHATAEATRAVQGMLDLVLPGWQTFTEQVRWRELTPGKPTTIGDITATPFEVQHTVPCVGVRLAQGSSTAVFTADTRPCPNVVEYARDADLLVHEVASLDADAAGAHIQGHSTAADAGRAAREAGARRLLLTHLPPSRVAEPAALAKEARGIFRRPVGLARDLLAVEF